MDPVQPSIQSANPKATPEVASSSNRGPMSKVMWALLGIVVLVLVSATSYYLGTQKNQSMQPAKTQNNSKTVAVTKMPTATPTPDPTANWQTYSNTKYGYSVKYPVNLSTNEQNTYYHYVEFNPAGTHILPTFLIAVIPDSFVAKNAAAYNFMSSDWINTFIAMKVGDTKTDAAVTFTKLADTTVAGQTATVIEVTAQGPKQQRVYLKKNGYLYMISNSYQAADELQNFTLFLSTFKFTQ